MIPTLGDLAAQIVALPGWEWRPGMLDSATGLRIVKVLPDGSVWLLRVAPVNLTPRLLIRTRDDIRLMEMRPDLTDPATAGAMLGMLSGQRVQAQMTPDGWRVVMVFTDLSPSVSACAPHLGEAIARMVVARGGWR